MKKLINKLPLMAFVLGFGLMLTMNSFTTKRDTVRLYRLGTGTTWITEAQLQELIGPDQEFVCTESTSYCSADFDETVTPTGITPSEAKPATIDFGDGEIRTIQPF